MEYDLSYSNSDSFIRRSITFARYSLRSVAVALSEDYDVLFATTTPLTACLPGVFARWLRRKPFVFEVRDLWPELPKEMGVITNPIVLASLSALEWIAYKSAHRLVALSPGIGAGIERRGIDRNLIAMIPNGCDIDLFSRPANVWRPPGVRPDDFLAIYAGTHGIANGLGNVLDAARILQKRGRSDIRLVLVGDGAKKSELQSRARRYDLDNLIFHQPVSKTDLVGLLHAADVGMQILANVPAFYYGTSPNKFFDYIAAGLPVLNNYPGWLAELIEEWKCGVVVNPDDPKGFADALESLADDRSRILAMGTQARQLAEMLFNRQELAGRFHRWLEHTVEL